ncbi:Asp-tRNA(Asn)/Glu-tRNA(Gln) amidotransferase subunit GatC [Elioraea tepida]|uniref:Aspartyl/glutamyl-tRNA(Asn/Gln) amidotransferase subunit C n=1 Tax=Elioraea tepida TaxID=2843330 RepID=A0A975U423_9PROT|nr:Asp-tRNA(Asn)/Glu-tRNA(Gln) amidotransferase subunit GatC [Elioraea tepida]QXM24978.1 Asp-tRNA(Asn)/Glu-tRNA(Gln) amidotransferase subunit GatC [Elioraea tepida]
MSLDADTIRRIASLARIRLSDEEAATLEGELNGILAWIDQLNEVDTEGVAPLSGVGRMTLRMREDVVDDGNIREKILANAPERIGPDGAFFAVPKVVE